MKLLIVTTDSAHAFSLDLMPPMPPVGVGDTATLKYAIQGEPLRFLRLKLERDERVQILGPDGAVRSSGQDHDDDPTWRVDEVTLDGAQASEGQDGWGIGRSLVMRVTNVSGEPRHFYGTWECDDVR